MASPSLCAALQRNNALQARSYEPAEDIQADSEVRRKQGVEVGERRRKYLKGCRDQNEDASNGGTSECGALGARSLPSRPFGI